MRRMSDVERKQLWDRYEAGKSFRSIRRRLGRATSTVRTHVVDSGWKRPVPDGDWHTLRLSLDEREEISRGLASGESLRCISRRPGRSPSTVSREVRTNGGLAKYRAAVAHRSSRRRTKRPKHMKLETCPRLAGVVEEKLELRWSPSQISRWLVRAYPDDEEMRVSHETIYQSLFIRVRGGLRKELWRCPRTGRAVRWPQGRTCPGQGKIRVMVMISDRPPEVDDRAVPGHWEGDLIMGRGMSAIGTLVERQTRYVMLFRLPDDNTALSVRTALAETVLKLPKHLWRFLTWDQGPEMSQHAKFTIDTGIQVYFCDPRSPWQRGPNENTNGLLRQYFPKGSDLSVVTQE